MTLDEQLQAAYQSGNKSEIIRLATMVMEVEIKKTPDVVTNAWRNACSEKSQREYALESRILARDERATMDF